MYAKLLYTKKIVLFIDNFASYTGGAIFAQVPFFLPCFLVLTSYSGALKFQGNSAKSGTGMHIYGASTRLSRCAYSKEFNREVLPYCGNDKINITFLPGIGDNFEFSPVSSEPKRVCLCDLNGYPQCTNLSKIFFKKFRVYSDESITLSLVAVGYDFGATLGTVHANFTPGIPKHHVSHLRPDQYHQWVPNVKECSSITYTIYSVKKCETLYLHTKVARNYAQPENKTYLNMNTSVSKYNLNQNRCLSRELLLNTPVFIKIKILPGCPCTWTYSQ
jgi:predicted outer membrane repeat protein